MISAVGIKRILFADTNVVTADITPEIAKTLISAAITAKNEVQNVHGETWQIEESEASVTGYKNQLSGQNYRYDTTLGDILLSLSVSTIGRRKRPSWVERLLKLVQMQIRLP